MSRRPRDMSQEERSEALRDLRKQGPETENAEARLIHDLEVHQIELEMQNHELRMIQERLEGAQARYAELYDLAPIAYLTLDGEGRILEANLTAASMFGLERGRMVGRVLSVVGSFEPKTALRDHLRRCFSERARSSSEALIYGAQIGHRPIQLVSVPVFDAQGRAIACRTTLTDISALKRSEDKLRFLAQASATVSASFDYEANVAEVTRRAVPLFADLCITDLLDKDGKLRRLEVAISDAVLDSGGSLHRVARNLPPSTSPLTPAAYVIRTGETILIPESGRGSPAAEGLDLEPFLTLSRAKSLMFVPIVNGVRVQGVMTFALTRGDRGYGGGDLSSAKDLGLRLGTAIENARLYENAQHAIEARQDVLSFVSHDLRNALMAIMLSVESLLHSAPATERRRGAKHLERIHQGGKQMRRMIEDLLDVASLEAGRLWMKVGEHDLRSILEEVSNLWALAAAEKEITIDLRRPAHPYPVRCDRERVLQVFSNLMGNALKFTPQKGRVTISVATSDDQAVVSVQDTGNGIPARLMPRLFERYAQAQDTAHKGRGLGLYIAKGIVEAHGGKIWADSRAGSGAVFYFTLNPAGEKPGVGMDHPQGSLRHPTAAA